MQWWATAPMTARTLCGSLATVTCSMTFSLRFVYCSESFICAESDTKGAHSTHPDEVDGAFVVRWTLAEHAALLGGQLRVVQRRRYCRGDLWVEEVPLVQEHNQGTAVCLRLLDSVEGLLSLDAVPCDGGRFASPTTAVMSTT